MSTKDVSTWIESSLIGHNRFLTPTGFATSLTLSQTELEDDFAPWLLGDRAAYLAPFEGFAGKSACNQLLQSVRRASSGEPASWFYVVAPDNVCCSLQWLRSCDYDRSYDWGEWLEPFEKTPAPEGGVMWIGLAGEGRQWLLLQKLNPYSEYVISIHGPPDFCREVATGVGVCA